ncbi:MAG: hypothetical protein ACRD4R_10180 [Candidatus Acidiferrales bacterium]
MFGYRRLPISVGSANSITAKSKPSTKAVDRAIQGNRARFAL